MATLILNASEILTMAGPDGPRAGQDKGTLGLLRDGAVLIDQGKIVAAIGISGPTDRGLPDLERNIGIVREAAAAINSLLTGGTESIG